MNTNTSTNDSSINEDLNLKPVKTFDFKSTDLIDATVRLPNGGFYAIIQSGLGFVYLKQQGFPNAPQQKIAVGVLLLEINKGNWPLYVNGDYYWRINVYTPELMAHKNKVLKAVIYNQLCLEANDDLRDTLDHDNYLDNLLIKANKGLERKTKQSLAGVYGADPQMLSNIFKTIDKFVGLLADKLPHEFFYLNSIVEEYDADPKKFIGRKVMLDVIE
jgi:hypothetical protein